MCNGGFFCFCFFLFIVYLKGVVIMQIVLIVLVIALGGFAVWQFALLIRDIIRKVKSKKSKGVVDSSVEDDKQRKE